MPSHIGPPWCGQRLNSPKNSPSRLNTAIERPRTVTSLRLPGGISATVATTCLLILALLWLAVASASERYIAAATRGNRRKRNELDRRQRHQPALRPLGQRQEHARPGTRDGRRAGEL